MSQLTSPIPSAVVSVIAQCLCTVAEQTGKKVEKLEAETWCRAFADCDPDELRQAFESHALHSPYPPTMFAIHQELQLLRFGGNSGAWLMVHEAAKNSGHNHYLFVFEHPAIHFAIESIGGWSQLTRQIKKEDRFGLIQRDFVEAFDRYRPSVRHVAGLGHFDGSNAVLIGHRGRALNVYRTGLKQGQSSVPGVDTLKSQADFGNTLKVIVWPEQLGEEHMVQARERCTLPPRWPWESDEAWEARIAANPTDNSL